MANDESASEHEDDAEDDGRTDLERMIEVTRFVYRLNGCCLTELRYLAEHFHAWSTAADDDRAGIAAAWDAPRLHEALGHGQIGWAFPTFLHALPSFERTAVDEYADLLIAHDQLASFGWYLRARDALFACAPVEAMEYVARALGAEPDNIVVLDLHAHLLADSGDPLSALAVRKTIVTGDGGTDPQVQALREILRLDVKVGRNEPCPCGSGRKYKQCCERDPKVSTPSRRRLALHQALNFATVPEGGAQDMFEMVVTAATVDGVTERQYEEMARRVSADPFLIDVNLHEGGHLAEYIAQRAAIIPPDELTWLRSLADAPLGLWEATDTGDGAYGLRELVTGEERADIRFPAGSRPTPGFHLLGRVVGDGVDGGATTTGPVLLVPPQSSDGVIELLQDEDTRPKDWARWFGERVFAAMRTRA